MTHHRAGAGSHLQNSALRLALDWHKHNQPKPWPRDSLMPALSLPALYRPWPGFRLPGREGVKLGRFHTNLASYRPGCRHLVHG